MTFTRIIGALVLALTTFSTNAATVYQSAAYGTSEAANNYYCSNCSFAPTATIGETFAITSESVITGMDFYISSLYGSDQNIFINFFDSSANPVFSELFTTAHYTKTDLDLSVSNINAIFDSPLTLAAGNYAVFWFADDLAIPAYDGLGFSQLYTDGSFVPFATGSASAIRLNGSISALPIPESDTYAMLLVGLGLMGEIVRRRK